MDESADTGHVPAEHHDERQCSCESITPHHVRVRHASACIMDKAQPFISNDSGGLFCGKVDLRGKKINLDDPLCRLSVTVIFASLRRHRNGNVTSAGHALGTDPSTIRRAALLQLVSDLDAEERILVQDAYPEETRVDGACICGHHVHSADITSARNETAPDI